MDELQERYVERTIVVELVEVNIVVETVVDELD